MSFETIDIFIVNDDSSDRELLATISSYPNIKIVGEANNADRAILDLNNLLKQEISLDLIVFFCRDRASFIAGKSEFQSYQKLIDIAPNVPIFILSGSNCTEQFINVLGRLKNQKNKIVKFSEGSASSKNREGKIQKLLADNASFGLQQIQQNLDRVNRKLENIQANSQKTDKFFQKNSKVFFDLLFWQGRRRELLVAKLLVEKIKSTLPDRTHKKDAVKLQELRDNNKNIGNDKLINNEGYSSKINMENERIENIDLATISASDKTSIKPFNCQLFNKIFQEIGFDIANSTGLLLEIDVLKERQKIDLFKIILKQLDRIYLDKKINQEEETEESDEFKNQLDEKNKNIKILKNQQEINIFQKIFKPAQLAVADNKKKAERQQDTNKNKPEKRNELVPVKNKSRSSALELEIQENENILLEIWQESTKYFLKKCLEDSSEIYDIEAILEEELININEEILNKIPLFYEAFNWLVLAEKKPEFILGKKPKKELDKIAEIAGEKAVKIVIQNSIVKIANATIVVILNNFIRVESVEKKLYKPNLISSREMARVRNNLSWRYRKEKYFEEPKNIFESQYRLFYFNGNKIYVGWFYNPRYEELNQLRGIPWLTTIAIETRDALAPILQAIVGFVGEAIFYFLKDVIGRGIGLIGQGIIQGVGNALQDNRYSKNNKRTK